LILGEESHVYDMASRSQAKPVEGRQLAEVRGGRSAALSPDGKTLAIGYGGGAVDFYDAETWQPKKEYLEAGHRSGVTALSVSPDGQAVYSIGADMTLRRWDLAAVAKPPLTCQLDAADAHLLKCDPQGKSLATGSPKSLTLWDAATITPLAADSIWPNSLVYSPDGASIALQTHGDNHVCLRDVQLRETYRFTSINEQAALAFSPDGTLLAAVATDGAAAIGRVNTGRHAAAWKDEKLSSVAFRPDGQVLALGHADGAISLWDTVAWQKLLAVQAHAGPVLSLSFMPHGKSLVSSGTDGVIQVKNTERERSLTTIPVGMAGPAVAFDLDPSGQFLFASGPTNAIYVHRLSTDD
jgi:WD40 repeat protein